MDYTTRPETNMQPDRSNFEFLAEIYGTVGEITSETNGEKAARAGPGSGDQNRKGRRNLIRRMPARYQAVPEDIMNAFDDVDLLIDNGMVHQVKGWRRLHESPHGETHAIDVGDGLTIEIGILRYVPLGEKII